MQHRELNIPLSLTKHILSDNRESQFKVYLALKGVYGSHVKKIDYTKIAMLCGFSSEETVSYHIKKLLQYNWVGQHEGQLFLRPISYLCDVYNAEGGKVHKIDLITQLPYLQELLFSMSLKKLIIYRKYVGRKIRRCEQAYKYDYKIQDYKTSTMSVRLIATLLNLSVNKVHRLKMKAIEAGYLERDKNARQILASELSYLFFNHREKVYKTKGGSWIVNLTDDLYPFINTKMSKHYSF